MRVKVKILILLFIVAILTLGTGITYSIFTSDTNATVSDQKIAKFVFDTELLDHLSLPIVNLTPGSEEEYNFKISNTSKNTSNVTLNYQITIKTFHFIPLVIELYKVGETDELIMTCDENYSRGADNELVCNAPVEVMEEGTASSEDYKIKVSFPSSYNDKEYADSVDYIDVEVKSWQKMN